MSALATPYFGQRPNADLRRTALGVAMLASAIAAGWWFGQLTIVCLVMIGLHVWWQGLIPISRAIGEIDTDTHHCAEEMGAFQRAPVESLSVFETLDTSDAGSLMKLVAAVALSGDRMEPERALEIHLKEIRQPQEARLKQAATAAEQATMLGLGGSFLGLLGSLQGGAELTDGVGTMLLTTLAGVLGAFALMGLGGAAGRALDRHMNDLEIAASYVLRIGQGRDDDQFESLFQRG